MKKWTWNGHVRKEVEETKVNFKRKLEQGIKKVLEDKLSEKMMKSGSSTSRVGNTKKDLSGMMNWNILWIRKNACMRMTAVAINVGFWKLVKRAKKWCKMNLKWNNILELCMGIMDLWWTVGLKEIISMLSKKKLMKKTQ